MIKKKIKIDYVKVDSKREDLIFLSDFSDKKYQIISLQLVPASYIEKYIGKDDGYYWVFVYQYNSVT